MRGWNRFCLVSDQLSSKNQCKHFTNQVNFSANGTCFSDKTECRIDAWPVYCSDIQRLLAKAVDFSYHSISHTLASLQFLLILVHFIHKLESFHLLLHISIGCQCVTSEYTLNAHVANNILRNLDKLIVPFRPLSPLWALLPFVGPLEQNAISCFACLIGDSIKET